MHVVKNFLAYRERISTLNDVLQTKFVKALEKELSTPDFVDLMVNNTIESSYFQDNETQIIIRFVNDSGEFITLYCIML